MKIVDLFCGCGGLSLGFQNAGLEIAAAFDNWQAAILVYEKNFSHPVHQIDLNTIEEYSAISRYEPDMVIGGPPCQDFSIAGKKDDDDGDTPALGVDRARAGVHKGRQCFNGR